jgi:hypothetical protein
MKNSLGTTLIVRGGITDTTLTVRGSVTNTTGNSSD